MHYRCTMFFVFFCICLRSCFSCTTGCVDCTSTGSCTSCASNYLSIEKTCTESETNPYITVCYYNCIPCSASAHCKTCSGSSSSCTNCTRGYHLSGTSCYAIMCSSRCMSCTNSYCLISTIIGIVIGFFGVLVFIFIIVTVMCVWKKRRVFISNSSRFINESENENAMSA